MSTLRKRMLTLGIAGALVLGAVAPGFAGPVFSGNATLKNAVPSDVIEIRRWRRGTPGAALALGMFGVIAGLAAHEIYRERYSEYHYPPYPHADGPYPYGYYHGHPGWYGGRW